MRPAPVLAGLVALDLTLAVWGFFFPAAWFQFFHGAEYVDPQGLLRRCAANWLAFGIIEAIALARWKADGRWLIAVAGMRLGDALTDVTCLAFAASVTPVAWVLFVFSGVGNLGLGWWLWRVSSRRG